MIDIYNTTLASTVCRKMTENEKRYRKPVEKVQLSQEAVLREPNDSLRQLIDICFYSTDQAE
jgi:hypothetical protein